MFGHSDTKWGNKAAACQWIWVLERSLPKRVSRAIMDPVAKWHTGSLHKTTEVFSGCTPLFRFWKTRCCLKSYRKNVYMQIRLHSLAVRFSFHLHIGLHLKVTKDTGTSLCHLGSLASRHVSHWDSFPRHTSSTPQSRQPWRLQKAPQIDHSPLESHRHGRTVLCQTQLLVRVLFPPNFPFLDDYNSVLFYW